MLRLRDPLARAASLAEQDVADVGRARRDRLGVLRRGELRGDLRRLARSQAARRDLGRLVLEQLLAAQELPRVDRERGERGPVRAPLVDGRRRRPPAASPCPPNASSRSRCQSSSSSRCWSCWPWISTSGPVSEAEPAGGDRLVVEPGGGPAAGAHLADAR